MTEKFLQFIWQHQLFDSSKLETITGEPITVITIGTLHNDSGPDFFNAKIKIGNTIWAGDVEIHIKSSDWQKHHHQKQKQYNSVILHVVSEYDKDYNAEHGNYIPTTILPIPSHILQNYVTLQHNSSTIRCSHILPTIDTFYQNMWFDRLVIERYESKTNHLLAIMQETTNSWEETLYINLARNFGFKTNADAFERLAKSIPLHLIKKHSNNLFQIEALLFGQAGMLEKISNEEYTLRLQTEYTFLQKKYSLKPLPIELWKFGRMRPANFPSIRIAEFAELISSNNNVSSVLLELHSIKEISKLFSVKLHSFWDTHYTLFDTSEKHIKQIGNQSIEIIIINTVIPFLFAHGTFFKNDDITQRAIQFLEEISSEKNSIIEIWNSIHIESHSAYRSQALIQLYNEYCNKGKCLQCCFGLRWMKQIK